MTNGDPRIGPFLPGAPASEATRAAPLRAPRAGDTARPGQPSFAEHLARATRQLSFSKHALQRLERRNIELDPASLARLHAGVERAAAKGSRDAVVFVDGVAFVVSVRNRTVVTAVDREHMREHVFTNIDSAVIA